MTSSSAGRRWGRGLHFCHAASVTTLGTPGAPAPEARRDAPFPSLWSKLDWTARNPHSASCLPPTQVQTQMAALTGPHSTSLIPLSRPEPLSAAFQRRDPLPSPQKAQRLPLPGPDFGSGSDCPEGFEPGHNLLSCECRPGTSDSDGQAVRGGQSHPDQNKPNWLQNHAF